MKKAFLLKALRRLEKALLEGVQTAAVGDTLAELSSEQVAELHRYFKMPKFFILGYARSGKTLLARLTRLHEQVHCNGHAYITRDLMGILATPALNEWLERDNNQWTQGEELVVPIIRLVSDFIMERQADRQGKSIVGDESPNKHGGAGVRNLHAIFPDASLIHVIRDGRDTVLWQRVRQFIYFPENLSKRELAIRDQCRRDADQYVNGKRSIFTTNWFEAAARTWANNIRTTHEQASKLFGDRYMVVRFEDLLERPVDRMDKVWSFLGARTGDDHLAERILQEIRHDPDAQWREEEDPDLIRNLKPGLEGGWRAMYTDEDRRLFERIAGKELAAWGYEVAGD